MTWQNRTTVIFGFAIVIAISLFATIKGIEVQSPTQGIEAIGGFVCLVVALVAAGCSFSPRKGAAVRLLVAVILVSVAVYWLLMPVIH